MPTRPPKLVHGDNLREKETHRTKYQDDASRLYLAEIRWRYDQWHHANMTLIGPGASPASDDEAIVRHRVKLFEEYKDFIDQQHYAEQFDSRSNLHSTVLEEFLYYLFKDLINDFGEHALIGKSHTFKDIFFTPPSYEDMLKRPYAKIEIKDHDFVIGVTYETILRTSAPSHDVTDAIATTKLNIQEPRTHYGDVVINEGAETHFFDVPAVAIECKTYLDKTMLEGSSRAAEEIKTRNPNGIYIVVMEWIKLSDAVNLRKYKVDQIYVLRKQKNTDREFRYLPTYVKNPIDSEVVFHLFNTVRDHLTKDWTGGIAAGLERGWLIE
jgi:hypothetical protein